MSDLGFSLLQNGSMSFSSATDFDKAKNYTDKEITIKSISANGSAIVPDENKNVDIDIKGVVKQSYLSGTGAPTTSTAAEFVGQLYSDTQNIKLYQCTGITEAEDGTKTYEWIKVIRENDYPTTDFAALPGVVRVSQGIYGLSVTTMGLLMINNASNSEINKKKNQYLPITPSNLDYAVRSVRPVTSIDVSSTLSVNTVYSINHSTDTTLNITLPEGKVGDFVQYDFVTGSTAPTVTIESVYGMTEFDFTPEANKIYSLFFDWGMIAASSSGNTYGWRISYAEYDYDDNAAAVLPEEDL